MAQEQQGHDSMNERQTTPPQPIVSIVIPAYNEVRRLPATLPRVLAFAESLGLPFEIVVVDDGSTDGTRRIVREVAATRPEVRLIENPHSGKAFTVRTGMLQAAGRYAVQADADLSTPPGEFIRLIAALDAGAHVAIGSRAGRPGAPWYRNVMSFSWRVLVATLGVRGFHDTQCGFKAYRAETARQVFPRALLYNAPAQGLKKARVTAASDVELLVIARRLGYTIAEVPLEWNYTENTKISPVRDSLWAFVDLLRISWHVVRGAYGGSTGYATPVIDDVPGGPQAG
jgi:glycosyltransferase involved in cell wall biosynthesis